MAHAAPLASATPSASEPLPEAPAGALRPETPAPLASPTPAVAPAVALAELPASPPAGCDTSLDAFLGGLSDIGVLRARNAEGLTLLGLAIESDRPDLVRVLAPKCDLRHACDSDDYPPLLFALKLRRVECVRVLIESAPDPTALVMEGHAAHSGPLFSALTCSEALAMLLPHAPASALAGNGRSTLLMTAIYYGQTASARLLIPLCDVNAVDRVNGDTALSIAGTEGRIACVRALLAAPGILTDRDAQGAGPISRRSPLSAAIASGHQGPQGAECSRLLARQARLLEPLPGTQTPALLSAARIDAGNIFLALMEEHSAREPFTPEFFDRFAEPITDQLLSDQKPAVLWACVDSWVSELVRADRWSEDDDKALAAALARHNDSAQAALGASGTPGTLGAEDAKTLIPQITAALEARTLSQEVQHVDALMGDSDTADTKRPAARL